MEKISVIVPIYKAEKFIERTVRSVISQTYTPVSYTHLTLPTIA